MEFNENLAEIVGIMLGDGCLHSRSKKSYQIVITSGKNEREWLNYVKKIFEEYFKKEFRIIELKDCFQLKSYSLEVANKLIKADLRPGNKKKNQVEIPKWITENKIFLTRVVQGLFDTDGCVYNKYGKYAQIEFKFGCLRTTESVRRAILSLGFNPTRIQRQIHQITGNSLWRFYMSRQQEIERFFTEIVPKNQKHQLRYRQIKDGNAGI